MRGWGCKKSKKKFVAASYEWLNMIMAGKYTMEEGNLGILEMKFFNVIVISTSLRRN